MGRLRAASVIGLLGALLAAWGYLAADTRVRAGHLGEVSALQLGSHSPAPAPGVSEPTQLLSLSGADGYQWVLHADAMRAGGGWRIHRTEIDNAPHGREVHWSSGLIWWLRLLTALKLSNGAAAGDPLGSAALVAGPILYAILLLVLSLALRRRLGWMAATAIPVGVLITPRLAEFFQAGYFDHHGITALAGLATALFAAAAAADPGAMDQEASGRRWMRGSALAGAAGLWISSASIVPVLVGVGFGGLLASILAGRGAGGQAHGPAFRPRDWREWGWIGAAGSFVFYILEYFPSSMGMRLEVNHPLYAVAWAGAGELLFRATRRLGGGRWIEAPRDRLALPAAGLAFAALPLLIAAAPSRFFWVSDRFLWTLHQDIGEFQSLGAKLRQYGLVTTVRANAILPLLAIPALFAILRPAGSARARGMLAVTLSPALLVGLLACIQVRWAGNQEALWLGVLVALVCLVAEGGGSRWTRPVLAGFMGIAVLSAWPATLGPALRGRGPSVQVSLEDQMQLVMRDVARRIRKTAGEGAVVLAGPSATTELIYFGGLRGVGTLYWENRDGLRAAASIYGAGTAEEALARIRSLGVTHLVSFSWENYADRLARLHRDTTPGPGAERSFARLLQSPETLPIWTRPIPYSIPKALGLEGQSVQILEVHPEQSSAEHFAWLGDALLQAGTLSDAREAYRRALADEPGQAQAGLGLARALFRAGEAALAWQAIEVVAAGARPEDRTARAAEIVRLGGQCSPIDPHLAVRCYRRALDLDARSRAAWNNLAWILATSTDPALRDGAEATRAARALAALDPEPDPISLDTLAAALAESGRWAEATATAEQAVDLAERRGLQDVADYRARLELYRSRQPYRQPERRD